MIGDEASGRRRDEETERLRERERESGRLREEGTERGRERVGAFHFFALWVASPLGVRGKEWITRKNKIHLKG